MCTPTVKWISSKQTFLFETICRSLLVAWKADSHLANPVNSQNQFCIFLFSSSSHGKQARGASCRKAEPRYGVSSENCAFTATISQMRRISNSHKVFTPNKELCMRVIINSSEVYHSGTIAWIWHNGSTVPEVNIFWGFVTFVFFHRQELEF